MKKILGIVGLTAVLGLTGCAAPLEGNRTYNSYETGVAQSVNYGVVESVRAVTLNKGSTGIGAGTGAILGGIVGSQIGGGWGSAAAGVAGAVAGGMAGQAIERNNSYSQGIEVTVRFRDGSLVAVSQPLDERFERGDRVRVLTTNGRTRVTRDN
jgi:outer membrane lipoprotein SlyB